jgi:hypothetical protein
MRISEVDCFIQTTWFDYRFIFEKMKEYGDEYNEKDFSLFISIPKTVYTAMVDGSVIAFGCVLHYNGEDFVTYTWNDGSMIGKKAYVKGINLIFEDFPNVKLIGFDKKYNFIGRLSNVEKV